MIHPAVIYTVAAALIGLGVTGVLVRRNAVLVLIGVELILSGSLILVVASGLSGGGSRWSAGSVIPLFVITIAAAEVVIALAVILSLFRATGRIDLNSVADTHDEPPAGDR